MLLGMLPHRHHSGQGQLQEQGVEQRGFGPEPVALGLVLTAAERHLSFVQSQSWLNVHTQMCS